MGKLSTHFRLKDALVAAIKRGVTKEEIFAAVGTRKPSSLPTKERREEAILRVEALQPITIQETYVKPLSKKTIAALEDSTIQTKVINYPDGRKERIAIPLDRAKEGAERTVVVVVNGAGDKTVYETIRDDLVKGFASAAGAMKEFGIAAEKAWPKDNVVSGYGLCADTPRCHTVRCGDGSVRKFEGETRIWTSAPLPPAKPALPVQKVWPIGMGLLGTAYKEYD